MDQQDRTQQLEALTDEALGRLAEQLSRGHTDAFKELLAWHAQFWKYSLRNTLLIKEQCKVATRVASYKLWQKLGYQVAGGQQAIFIFAPLLKKETVEGQERQVLTGFRPVPVFDASQLTEESQRKLPTLHHPLPDDCGPLYEAMKANLKGAGVRVFEKRLTHGTFGSCDATGLIKIHEDQDSRNKVLTLAHEVCHFAAHFNRQEEGLTTRDEEFQAESVAVVIGAMFGFENPTAADYILSWHGTADQLRAELQTIHGLVKKVMGLLKVEALLSEARESEAA